MTKLNHISRFWRHLLAHGGSMTRWDLGKKVFSGNWAKHEMDELLRYPLLTGLIELTRERTNDRRGPIPTRIVLTAAGFALAETWQAKMPTTGLPLERVREEFNKLVAAGAPWAADLMKYAALGRVWEEQERQRKEERRLKDEERRKRQEAKIDSPAKHPSKGRHRSPAEEAKRQQWREAHFRKPEDAWQRPKPSPQLEPPSVAPEAPVNDWQPPQFPSWMMPTPPAPKLDAKTASLVEQIRQAGYTVDLVRGLIRYDNRWVAPAEWLRLMPGVL